MTEETKKVIGHIEALTVELGEIYRKAAIEKDLTPAWERLARWKERAKKILVEKVSNIEAESFDELGASGITGEPFEDFMNDSKAYLAFLKVLIETLRNHPEEVLVARNAIKETQLQKPVVMAPDSRSVFIIHGHDEANKLALEKLLKEEWGLEPLVLSYQPGTGRTLIEKFEEEAGKAVYAFALLTPDDIVVNEGQKYVQAHPNVIFELGWFYGKLGRNHVCILMKRGTKIHSDLDGISRIEFDESVEDKVLKIRRELKSAGLVNR
jgi:predicted nucleotide-binding protein